MSCTMVCIMWDVSFPRCLFKGPLQQVIWDSWKPLFPVVSSSLPIILAHVLPDMVSLHPLREEPLPDQALSSLVWVAETPSSSWQPKLQSILQTDLCFKGRDFCRMLNYEGVLIVWVEESRRLHLLSPRLVIIQRNVKNHLLTLSVAPLSAQCVLCSQMLPFLLPFLDIISES